MATLEMKTGSHDFVSAAYGVRVFSGQGALERLPAEARRLGMARPLLLCGRSVEQGGLPARIGASFAASSGGGTPPVFAGLRKEAPLSCVLEAVAAARGHHADGLIAIGAGSVLKAARVVAILLAEDRPVEQLVTRYPAEGPAISPRLPAPKLPIVNVLTAATTAQCRGGSALSAEGWDHRLEFFDPKTRPKAIFWDADALLTAPPRLARDTGAAVWWRALMGMAVVDRANPLVQAARHQAWRLAQLAMAALATDAGPARAGPRIDLCAAALLQNRDEDDGGAPMQAHWVARVVYALGAAVFTLHPAVSQGGAYAALTGAALRAAAVREPGVLAGIAQALGLPAATPSAAVAEAVEAHLARLGQPTRLRALELDREALATVQAFALKSFNADRHREFQREPGAIAALLQDAW
jgi:alcohol dehydrogenase class IV